MQACPLLDSTCIDAKGRLPGKPDVTLRAALTRRGALGCAQGEFRESNLRLQSVVLLLQDLGEKRELNEGAGLSMGAPVFP